MQTTTRPAPGLLGVARAGGQLIIRRHSAPFRSQVTWLFAGLVLTALILLGYLYSIHVRPGYLVFAVMVVVILLALVAQLYDVSRVAGRDDVFVFDKEADRFLRNGKVVAPIKDIDHILVRQIRVDENEQRWEYALVVALEDTRRVTVAESMGVSGAKDQIYDVARELAAYAGVEVQEAARNVDEWWLDG